MKQYEKKLKQILELTVNKDYDIVHEKDINITPQEIKFLQALGTIELHPAGDDEFYIIPTDAGIAYFHAKRQRVKDTLANWSMNIAIAMLSSLFGAILARLSLVLFP